MMRHASYATVISLVIVAGPAIEAAQAISPICTPTIAANTVVVSAKQRYEAGLKAQPPLNPGSGFDWPDTPMGVIKTSSGYEFFGSDGGAHYRQFWDGHWVGNNKSGSFVTTVGTLDDPLGSGVPEDVSVSLNPDPSVNPNYPSYGYMGGGPVFQVPAGMPGAGNLLATYHAELPDDALYAALGLATSTDNGLHWTDLGEIIRLNQAYAPGLDGFEIGDGPLLLSPDGKYFYLYFPDWIANGTPHIGNSTNNVAVARAPVSAVLNAAFASSPPHTVTFEKFYRGKWDLQPAVGGASTDLIPKAPFAGYIDVHYNSVLQRYVMIISDDTDFAYSESADALNWTMPTDIGRFGPIAAYPTAVGLGDDPHILGSTFYVYFTHLPTNGTGWAGGEVRRLTVDCS
jgi:hypothetical protein